MPGWVEETMAVTTNPSPALEVALAYFRRLDAPGFRPRNDLHRREHTVRRAGGTRPRVLAPTGP